ncbi:MAG: hypothetical protein HY376_02270 [Candidatus Blackburnbacteria bacterium]|nr:hypothetical protein [Candidatus Blackburnbacteria bacterium]
MKEEIYRIIDGFLTEAKDQNGNDRSLERLNADRHLAADELEKLFSQALVQREEKVIEDDLKMLEMEVRTHKHSAGCGEVCKVLQNFITYKMENKKMIQEINKTMEEIRNKLAGHPLKNGIGLEPEQVDSVMRILTQALAQREKEVGEAWLEGRRCFTCGNEMEPKETTNTCDKCWEEN